MTPLKSLVGLPYQDSDAEGNYIGCFAPLYFLWNDLPRYPLPECQSDYFHEAFSRLCESFDVVASPRFDYTSAEEFSPVEPALQSLTSPTLSSAKQGSSPCFDYTSAEEFDILVFQLAFGVLHVGVYLGGNQFLHVQRGSRVEIARLSRLSRRVVAILRRGENV